MFSNQNQIEQIRKSIDGLLNNPQQRAFLFRTRFERAMIRLANYASSIGDLELKKRAEESREKLLNIIDKSNTTSDGALRSYILLEDDLREIRDNLVA